MLLVQYLKGYEEDETNYAYMLILKTFPQYIKIKKKKKKRYF